MYCTCNSSRGVKPKLDLLKTCVAAIPRILPEGMSREDLLDLLSRLTIHMDTELVRATMISLQSIITNFPSWRHNVTRIYSLFILRDIPDNCPLVLESAMKFLIQMVTHWKGLITAETQVSASYVAHLYKPAVKGSLDIIVCIPVVCYVICTYCIVCVCVCVCVCV